MNNKIKNLVIEWFAEKINSGDPNFDVDICIKDVGIDPLKKHDIEMVEELFEKNEEILNDYFFYDITSNT